MNSEHLIKIISGRLSSTAKYVVITLLAVMIMLPGTDGSRAAAPPSLQIVTLSSRPDMVSGGGKLVEVKGPSGTQKNKITLALNNKNITSSLKEESDNGSFLRQVG